MGARARVSSLFCTTSSPSFSSFGKGISSPQACKRGGSRMHGLCLHIFKEEVESTKEKERVLGEGRR